MQGDTYVFMDMESYEEVRVAKDDDWAAYLVEGTDCDVVFFNGNVISIEPPMTMTLKIASCDPGVKGNSAGGGVTKPAVLETGGTVQARLSPPCFLASCSVAIAACTVLLGVVLLDRVDASRALFRALPGA